MMVLIEVALQPTIKPDIFRSTLGGKRYLRVWWLWFAITAWNGNQKEFGDAIKNAVWEGIEP